MAIECRHQAGMRLAEKRGSLEGVRERGFNKNCENPSFKKARCRPERSVTTRRQSSRLTE